MQTFLQRMRRNGGDAADAAWHTIKYHFDYADLSQWEKRYMRNLFLFYTWYRKNIPLQFISIIQKPGFFSALTNSYIDLAEGATPFNVNWNSINPLLPDLSGPVPNSSLIPDYMTRLMASPTVNWNGHAVALSMGLPWADMNLITSAAENPEEGIRSFFNMLIPPARMGAELGFGQSLLTGQKLEGYENTTWSDLLDFMGAKLPEDDEGRPLLPWQVGAILNNVFPAVGRGAGYLKPPSSVEDQGTFSTLFGGGAGTALSGISAYVGPKEGERLDKAYIYKVYERAAQREVIMESGKSNAERDADIEKFDQQTAEWAADNAIPKKYLHVVQGLGPKWFISKSDRKAATETGLLSNDSGGIGSTVGTKGLFETGGSSALEPSTYEPPSKKYKSRTEEALDLLGPSKEQGFIPTPNAKPALNDEKLDRAVANLRANEKIERKLGPQPADRLHRGLEPQREAKAPKPTAPVRVKSRTAPTQPKPAHSAATEAATIKLLEENGASTQVARAAAKRMGPKGWKEAAEADALGYGNKPSAAQKAAKKQRHHAIATYHHIKDQVENEGLPQFSGFSNPEQEKFAQWFTKYSGLDPEFVGNWVLAESGGSAGGGPGGAGYQNWLGVRYPGETTHDSETHFNGTPKQAAREAVDWMYNEGSTQFDEHSASTIQDFKNMKDASPEELVEYLAGGSGWGTGAITLGNITYTGNTGVNPDNKKKLTRAEAKLESLGVNPRKLDNSAEGGFVVPYKAFGKHVKKDLHRVINSKGYDDESSTKPITIHGPNGGTVVREVQGSSGVASVINKGQDPEIVARLLLLSAKTGKTINILSAYRTPSQSESVGGFADDPHTKGEAMDIGVEGATIDSANAISEAEYESVGLYRPYGTAHGGSSSEDNHVQLLNGGSPATAGYIEGSTTSSGGSPASGAPVASGTPSGAAEGGPAAQSTTGYHPGRTRQAEIEAARMKQHILGTLKGKSSAIKSTGLKLPDESTIFGIVAKARAEAEAATAGGTSLTARTKRKPKFQMVK